MKLKELVQLSSWVILFELVGFFMGRLTQANIQSWYVILNKSTLTPPGVTFSIVWSILYAVLAVVGWALWQKRNDTNLRRFVILYFIQIAMNWAWTPIFFQFHKLGLSVAWLVTMIMLTGVVIVGIKNELKNAAIALTPYFIWLLFATYLSAMIWVLN